MAVDDEVQTFDPNKDFEPMEVDPNPEVTRRYGRQKE